MRALDAMGIPKGLQGGDRIAWVGSYMIVGYLDAPAFFVYMKRGGGHVRIGEMVDTVDEALALIADNEGVGA